MHKLSNIITMVYIITAIVLTTSLQTPLISFAAEQEISPSSLAIMGITPGKSTFDDVKRVFGETPAWHTGDAASSEMKICYRLSTDSQDNVVVFASNSEIASDRKITSIRLYGAENSFTERDNTDCAITRQGVLDLRTKNGLKLGLPEQEFYAVLGKPDQDDNSEQFFYAVLGNPDRNKNKNVVYSSCGKEPMLPSDPYYNRWSNAEGCFEDEQGGWSGKPYYDVCSWVTVRFKNSRAIYLEVGSISSIC